MQVGILNSSQFIDIMLLKLCAVLSAVPHVLACLGYEGGVPTPTSTKTNSAVIVVAAGTTFDGGWAKYDRGSGACNDQAEGGDADAVFLLRSGATLKNVIIGKNQAEGVHCDGPCTLEFVWFEDVCEDAITVVRCHPSVKKTGKILCVLTTFLVSAEERQVRRAELDHWWWSRTYISQCMLHLSVP